MRISTTKSMLLLLPVTGLLAMLFWYQSVANQADANLALPEAPDGAAPAASEPHIPAVSVAIRSAGSRTDFEHADDLFSYLQNLRAAQAAGDASALWKASQVMEYCAGYASNPTGYANDTRVILGLKGNGTAAMAAARDRVSQRCQRFVPADGFSFYSVRAKRVEAARAGSLAAEAALLAMGEPLSESNEYKQDLVQRVLRSADPQAYLAISPAMGIASSGQEAYFGRVSGTQYSELSWQIAACRLGADCSSGGALMTSYCANGGICSNNGSQDFYTFVLDAGVPRQGVESLNTMVDSLMSDIGGVQ